MSESFSPELVRDTLTSLAGDRQRRYVCAVSGGADSLSLAHALIQCGADVRLAHVNHHLQSESDDWARRVRNFAQQHDVPCVCLDAFPDGSGNVEARARDARYAALADNLRDGEVLLTAHHQDDQALTLLLQLLRGAGPAGLAAMPERGRCGAAEHWRPLLAVPAQALQRYAVEHHLPVIEDPSNAELRFDRNYLRAHVVPTLKSRWPAFARTLARSAAHCAQADTLLGELATLDAPNHAGDAGLNLSVEAIPAESRAENALRYALRERQIPAPATVRLREYVRQVRTSAADTEPCLALGEITLLSYERHVFFVGPLEDTAPLEFALRPRQPQALPNRAGTLVWNAPESSAPLTVRYRRGGERYGESPSRRLKQFLQERRVLPWCRSSVPLVFRAERLLAIGDWWQDDDLSGSLVWSPDTRFALSS
ncbi:MAG: tRNA lysidine(34) synthetase TilS [Gammaproteobacteria bacterium]